MKLFRILFLVQASFLFVHCNNSSNAKKEKGDSTVPQNIVVEEGAIAGSFSDQTKLKFDSTNLAAFLKTYPAFTPFKSELQSFYSNRLYTYAWFDENGLIEPTTNLYSHVRNMADEGLPQDVPYLKEYSQMMEGQDSLLSVSTRNAFAELMITGQYFNYARQVWAGIPESKTKSLEWYVARKKIAYDKMLDSMLKSAPNIKAPVYRQYSLLKSYLKLYREKEKAGNWVQVKADKSKYQPGDSSGTVGQIRQYLFAAGDLKENNGSNYYDSTLADAVKTYQRRFGLKDDGVIGKSVLNEMAAPISKRIQQIIVNMERCRWVENNPTGDYLVVNIPQFKLMVYDNDSLMWDCNVVVGEEMNKTVVFNRDLKYVVFSPYWYVPPGILNKEVKPGIRRNPNYLKSHNMEWNGGNVRQKPGPNNSLGLVKFLFPNSYNIYLHDSPAKSLFNETKRTFSHGCVRVGEPKKLAAYLLRNDQNWTDDKITAAMNSGKEQYVTLKNTVPVYIVYFTAWVDRQGRINFRDDVYKRDARLMEMIFEKSAKDAQ